MGLPVKRVSDWALKRRFNCGGYLGKYLSKSFTFDVTHQGQPEAWRNLPPGTISQEIMLRDRNGDDVAKIHQFLCPDGTLGASGFPDPKRIFTKRRSYRIHKAQTPITRAMKASAWIERKLARICSSIVHGAPPVRYHP